MYKLSILILFYLLLPFSIEASNYSYDNSNRLKLVQFSKDQFIEYDFDANGNITVVRFITSTDSDGDGLLDSWEQLIIDTNPNDIINTFADVLALDDFDNDGVNNYIEYKYNTDPTDDQSPSPGDLNIDQDITLSDVIIALQVVSGIDTPDAIGAGIERPVRKIGISDAIYILQILSNMR